MKTRRTGTGSERIRPAERRELVLQAAIAEFATYGLHGATTEGIAARAGITQPYVLRLFRTKLALFLATVERVCDRIIKTWERTAAELPPEAEPLARLEHLGLAYVGLMGRREELLLVLQAVAASNEPAVLATMRRRMEEMYGYVAVETDAPDDRVQRFFAQGMLLTVATGLDLPTIAAEQAWARSFIDPHPPLGEQGGLGTLTCGGFSSPRNKGINHYLARRPEVSGALPTTTRNEERREHAMMKLARRDVATPDDAPLFAGGTGAGRRS